MRTHEQDSETLHELQLVDADQKRKYFFDLRKGKGGVFLRIKKVSPHKPPQKLYIPADILSEFIDIMGEMEIEMGKTLSAKL